MKSNENPWKIYENQWKAMTINEKAMKINENLWKSMKISDNAMRIHEVHQWKAMQIYGILWKSMKFINENQWEFMKSNEDQCNLLMKSNIIDKFIHKFPFFKKYLIYFLFLAILVIIFFALL